MLTIFLVNLNTQWAYKNCQFNNYFLVKNADFLLVPWFNQEICKALASVVAMVIRGSFFMFVESGCISTNIEITVP